MFRAKRENLNWTSQAQLASSWASVLRRHLTYRSLSWSWESNFWTEVRHIIKSYYPLLNKMGNRFCYGTPSDGVASASLYTANASCSRVFRKFWRLCLLWLASFSHHQLVSSPLHSHPMPSASQINTIYWASLRPVHFCHQTNSLEFSSWSSVWYRHLCDSEQFMRDLKTHMFAGNSKH